MFDLKEITPTQAGQFPDKEVQTAEGSAVERKAGYPRTFRVEVYEFVDASAGAVLIDDTTGEDTVVNVLHADTKAEVVEAAKAGVAGFYA